MGLCLGNVGAGGRILVLDSSMGMLTGAVLERTGGYAEVTSVTLFGKSGAWELVKCFNQGPAAQHALRTCVLADLLALRDTMRREAAKPDTERDARRDARLRQDRASPPRTDFKIREAELRDRITAQFTSLIVVCPWGNVSELMTKLVPFLEPSAAFVCLHPSAQALAECVPVLVQARVAANLQVSGNILRDILDSNRIYNKSHHERDHYYIYLCRSVRRGTGNIKCCHCARTRICSIRDREGSY
jgi:hypothetical protein